MEKVLARLFKRKLLIIGLTTIVVFLPIVYLVMHNPKTTAAAWFDDSYSYRQLFSFTHNAAISSERSVTFSLDTAELIAAGLMQSDCDDTRFTDTGGDPLRFQLTGTCNNAATTYEVVFPSIINGTNSAYVYYGNPAAVSASQDVSGVTALTPSGGDPAITDRAVEEQGTTPVLYWKFDEGSGTTANDSTQYSNNGTFKAAGEPVIQNEEMCALGKCVKFDGSNDYVTKSYSTDTELDPGTASFSVSTWFRHSSTISGTDILIARADGLNGVGYKLYMNSSGFMCFGIDASAGSFPNDSACGTTSLADSQWHFIEGVKSGTTSITLYIDGKQITQTTSITTSSISGTSSPFYAGIDSDGTSNPWDGFIDDIKIYNYAKSASQTKTDFANRGSLDQTSASFGSTAPSDTLANGLVGYWAMDETSGNATDSSGNGYTLTNNNTTTFSSGKFGNASSYNGTSQYFSTATTIANVQTVSFWVNPSSSTDNYININGSTYITSSAGTVTATGFTSPLIYVNGVLNGTVTASTWNHILITTQTSLSASTFEVGRANGSFLSNTSKIDDVRLYNRAFSEQNIRTLYDWAPSPIGYWSLDEGRNTTANDISGNGNTGTLGGTTNDDWIIGKYGKALNYDSTDNDINAGSAAILDDIGSTSGGMTIMAWVFFRGNGESNAGRILDKASGTAVNGWDWRINSSDQMTFDVDFDGASNLQFNSSSSLSFDTWQHVVITWDGSANRSGAKYYINGVLAASTGGTDGAGNRVTDAAQSLHIGNNSSGSRTFNGMIDDVKIYNYIRTPKQIVSDMNAGHPAVGSPVGSAVGYWKMDEGTGVTAHDQSINANDLTLSAASWTSSGKFDKAWNGTNATWLSRADDPDFDFGSGVDFSLSLWVKSDSASNPATAEVLVDKHVATNNPGYRLYFNTSGQFVCDMDDDTASYPEDTATGTTDYYDGTWHHVICERDIAADKVNLYVDGKLHAQDTDLSATGDLSNTDSLTIGDEDATDDGDEFTGDIDEVKIYRYALNPSEVKVEYNQGKSVVLGALSTTSSGVADNSSDRSHCVPGDTTTCSGPVADWKMDEGSGTTINDTSGNANTSSAFTGDVAWTTGKYGRALLFDGTDDVVRIPETTSTDVGGTSSSYTVSAWIKTTDATGTIVAKNDGPGNEIPFQLKLALGLLVFQIQDASNTPGVSSSSTFNDGNWHYVTGVRDVTGDQLLLYADGILLGTATDTTTATTANNDDISIGNDGASYISNDLAGTVDAVSIYNYARTRSQVAWDYNRGAPIGWWKLDEGIGLSAHDASGNAMTGTLTNSPVWTTSGKYTNAVTFSGSSSNNSTVIDMGDQSKLEMTTFTLSAWVNRSGTCPFGICSIFSKGMSGNVGYSLELFDTGGSYKACMNINDSLQHVEGTSAINTGAWYHILATVDGTTIKVYVNGKLETSTAQTQTPVFGNETAKIGNRNTSNNVTFNGTIDDVSVFNYVLNATQVKTLYNEHAAIRFGPVTGAP